MKVLNNGCSEQVFKSNKAYGNNNNEFYNNENNNINNKLHNNNNHQYNNNNNKWNINPNVDIEKELGRGYIEKNWSNFSNKVSKLFKKEDERYRQCSRSHNTGSNYGWEDRTARGDERRGDNDDAGGSGKDGGGGNGGGDMGEEDDGGGGRGGGKTIESNANNNDATNNDINITNNNKNNNQKNNDNNRNNNNNTKQWTIEASLKLLEDDLSYDDEDDSQCGGVKLADYSDIMRNNGDCMVDGKGERHECNRKKENFLCKENNFNYAHNGNSYKNVNNDFEDMNNRSDCMNERDTVDKNNNAKPLSAKHACWNSQNCHPSCFPADSSTHTSSPPCIQSKLLYDKHVKVSDAMSSSVNNSTNEFPLSAMFHKSSSSSSSSLFASTTVSFKQQTPFYVKHNYYSPQVPPKRSLSPSLLHEKNSFSEKLSKKIHKSSGFYEVNASRKQQSKSLTSLKHLNAHQEALSYLLNNTPSEQNKSTKTFSNHRNSFFNSGIFHRSRSFNEKLSKGISRNNSFSKIKHSLILSRYINTKSNKKNSENSSKGKKIDDFINIENIKQNARKRLSNRLRKRHKIQSEDISNEKTFIHKLKRINSMELNPKAKKKSKSKSFEIKIKKRADIDTNGNCGANVHKSADDNDEEIRNVSWLNENNRSLKMHSDKETLKLKETNEACKDNGARLDIFNTDKLKRFKIYGAKNTEKIKKLVGSVSNSIKNKEIPKIIKHKESNDIESFEERERKVIKRYINNHTNSQKDTMQTGNNQKNDDEQKALNEMEFLKSLEYTQHLHEKLLKTTSCQHLNTRANNSNTLCTHQHILRDLSQKCQRKVLSISYEHLDEYKKRFYDE